MLKFHSYNIVFQEVPSEVTLALNLTNCPNRCKGCHSSFLQEDIGELLNKGVLDSLIKKYGKAITCICFMGGDADPVEVERLSLYMKTIGGGKYKTAWYSGKAKFPESISLESFDYLKLGPYMEKYGGLDSPETNQHFYRIEEGKRIDETFLFHKKEVVTAEAV